MTSYKNCQSCGMPLKHDPLGGGSNTDGSRNDRFCSHCFRDGVFTQPDISVQQMQALVKGKLKEFGFPGFLTPLFTRGISKLERWR